MSPRFSSISGWSRKTASAIAEVVLGADREDHARVPGAAWRSAAARGAPRRRRCPRRGRFPRGRRRRSRRPTACCRGRGRGTSGTGPRGRRGSGPPARRRAGPACGDDLHLRLQPARGVEPGVEPVALAGARRSRSTTPSAAAASARRSLSRAIICAGAPGTTRSRPPNSGSSTFRNVCWMTAAADFSRTFRQSVRNSSSLAPIMASTSAAGRRDPPPRRPRGPSARTSTACGPNRWSDEAGSSTSCRYCPYGPTWTSTRSLRRRPATRMAGPRWSTVDEARIASRTVGSSGICLCRDLAKRTIELDCSR